MISPMMSRSLRLLLALSVACMAFAVRAHAEPYLAVQNGYKCSACHVNPTGGGLRNEFGNLFAAMLLPMKPASGETPWTGVLSDWLRVGGDVRGSWSTTYVPGQPHAEQTSLDQARIYIAASPWPGHLSLYLDENLAQGQPGELESYARLDVPGTGLYVKGGLFYLPFGWRLQDQGAFVRQASGISMTTPDHGFEVGFDRGDWSAQLDYTRGAANAASGDGHQVTGQVAFVQSAWRVGLASSATQSSLGDRTTTGVFGGLRTGRFAWLGELDVVDDASFPGGTRRQGAALGEVDWNFSRGQNLKLTAEVLDPDRSLAEDQKARWSLVYEFTPAPFVQLRAGLRRYRGIPQSDIDNRRLLFVELHAFF